MNIEFKIENLTLTNNASTLNFLSGVVCHTFCTWKLT